MKPREAQPWAVHGQEIREQDPKWPLASGPAGWVVTEDLWTLGLTGLPLTVILLATPVHLTRTFPAKSGLPCAESCVTLINAQLPDE